MRGVVSLAAALALPDPFPGRDIILFLAFCSIFVTLVFQGTTLGWLVRRLGVTEEETALPEPETAQARAEISAAALDAVRQHQDSPEAPEHTAAAAELVQEYEVRAERASIEGQDLETKTSQLEAQQRLRLVAIAASRDKLAEQADTIDTETHRALGDELDLEEHQIRRALDKT
jgi:NhaP-type Na+/H+ or K+/H+ antiporter